MDIRHPGDTLMSDYRNILQRVPYICLVFLRGIDQRGNILDCDQRETTAVRVIIIRNKLLL